MCITSEYGLWADHGPFCMFPYISIDMNCGAPIAFHSFSFEAGPVTLPRLRETPVQRYMHRLFDNDRAEHIELERVY